jgi:mono/diheme cytochrome c family protein
MKKAFKVLGIIVLSLLVIVSGVAAYVKFALPKTSAAPNLTVERTNERIQRGSYLANAVMACTDCHSPRDWSKYAGPMYHDSIGSGSTLYGHEIGLPGEFHAKNITPYNLGNWTDGEIFRAITEGVSKDGRALFAIMPYSNFGKMDKEDIYSVIAWLRTLPSVEKDVRASEADFPMNFIINTMPSKATFANRPAETNTAAYGKYLVSAAACEGCHTRKVDGKDVGGFLAGGEEFHMKDMTVRSVNLTPHETGLKAWTRQQFIERFKKYAEPNYTAITVAEGEFNTPMPWNNFAQMSEKDLGAIYDYLRTLQPVENKVVKFEKN